MFTSILRENMFVTTVGNYYYYHYHYCCYICSENFLMLKT